MSKCYTRRQVMDLLHMKPRTFERRRKDGVLPYVEELQPSIPNHKLFRADLLDKYLSGEWGQSHYLDAHKKHEPRAVSNG